MHPFAPTQDALDAMMDSFGDLIRHNATPRPFESLGNTTTARAPFYSDDGDNGYAGWSIMPLDPVWSFVVEDSHHHVHWIHPAVRARLDTLTPAAITDYILARQDEGGSTCMSLQAQAHAIWTHCQADLAALDAHQRPVERLRQILASIHTQRDAQACYRRIRALFARSPLEDYTKWKTARIAVGLEVKDCPFYAEGPVARAYILAQMLASDIPAPSMQEARAAVAALHAHPGLDHDGAVPIAAAAIAAGLFAQPWNQVPHTMPYAGDIFLAELRARATGSQQPRHSRAWAAVGLGEICTRHPCSAHDRLTLLAQANATLAQDGMGPPLSLDECLHAYAHQEDDSR